MHPGLNLTNIDDFWVNLLLLSLDVPMFPHPQDLLASACKIQRDNDLMISAVTKTNTPYPKSVTISNQEDLKAACKNRGLVIKRDFSDSTSCTYLPPKDGEPNGRTEKVMAVYEHTKQAYGTIECLPRPAWMAQPYIPSLVEKGELRAFVVGGKLAYAVHTWPSPEPGVYSIELVENYTPLNLLQ